ncbi:hypothetical protein Cs7R123_43370 [Catellatospora sp. TT07R-123]|nr:hypothetical protein Cs7R123_43370 [Catellatospora sp. TT07R-123]
MVGHAVSSGGRAVATLDGAADMTMGRADGDGKAARRRHSWIDIRQLRQRPVAVRGTGCGGIIES